MTDGGRRQAFALLGSIPCATLLLACAPLSLGEFHDEGATGDGDEPVEGDLPTPSHAAFHKGTSLGVGSGHAGSPPMAGDAGNPDVGDSDAGDSPPEATQPSPEVLAWEPGAGSPLTLLHKPPVGPFVYAGTADGNLYRGYLRDDPSWVRIDDVSTSTGVASLPELAPTSMSVTAFGTWLTAGFAAGSDQPTVHFNGNGGSIPWVAGKGLPFTVLGVFHDPVSPDRVYATTTAGVYRSNDYGSGWSRQRVPNEHVTAIVAIGDAYPVDLWIGTNFGQLFVVSEVDYATRSNWIERTPEGLRDVPVSGLTVDPTDPNTVYLTMSALAPSAILATRDAGETWESLHVAPLPTQGSGGVATLSVNPMFPENLYLAMFQPELVPYRSADGGRTWIELRP